MMRFAPFFLAAALALGLSACANHPPMVAQTAFVDKVDVELRLDAKLRQDPPSAELTRSIGEMTRRESTRYARSGDPKRVHIAITHLHYKNPFLSALIGDSNKVAARVAVFDGRSGQPHGEFDAMAIDSYAVNGVAGAIIAAAQDRSKVDQRLSEDLASTVLERVYGSAVAQEARKRPVAEPAAPAAVAPEPAAPAPKPAPAKAREPRTAMATPTAR